MGCFWPAPLFFKTMWGCHALNLNHSHELCCHLQVHYMLALVLTNHILWYFEYMRMMICRFVFGTGWSVEDEQPKWWRARETHIRGKTRRIRWYLLVEWFKKTMETTYEHLRAKMVVRDGQTSSFRGRWENVLCLRLGCGNSPGNCCRTLHLRHWKWTIKGNGCI